MCRNKPLKEKLQLLTQSAFQLFDNELHLDDSYQHDDLHISMAFQGLEPKIKEIPDFNTCVNLINQDEKMIALRNKVVGIYSTAFCVDDEYIWILSFLYQLFFESKDYNQSLFDSKYNTFEELFYADQLRFRDFTRLFNFSIQGVELDLGDGVIIRRDVFLPDDPIFFKMSDDFSLRNIRSSFIVERIYQRKKIISNSYDDDSFDVPDWEKKKSELIENYNIFDRVISTLRIAKPSGIFRDQKIMTEPLTFSPHRGISTGSSFHSNLVLGSVCHISVAETDTIRDIFTFIKNEENNRFKVAIRRLSLGMERPNLEDKIIDFMIGFEALYLFNTDDDKGTTLSKRASSLIGINIDNYVTEDFLKRMYTMRNYIVHGNTFTLPQIECIQHLENLLRISINLWMEDPSKFSKNYLKIIFKCKGSVRNNV